MAERKASASFSQRVQRLDNCKICTQAQKRAMSLSAEPRTSPCTRPCPCSQVFLYAQCVGIVFFFWHFRQLRRVECRT